MPVRSNRFFAGNTLPVSAIHTVYTCPAGKTAIVKDVRVSSAGSSVSRAVVIALSGGQAISLLDAAVGTTAVLSVLGFIVLEPGDQLQVYSEGTAARVWISGAELDGVA